MGQGPHPDYKCGSIQRLDPKTGEAKLLYAECDGHKLSAPNDLVFDTAGGFYFTDLGKRYARHRDHGGIYYALPDGSKITCLVYPFMSPNGCGLSPDGKMLYVADTVSARLYAFDIEAPGVLAKTKADFAHTGRVVGGAPAGPAGFDSLAVLANGNICVATLTTGKITEFSPAGDDRARGEDAGHLSDQHLLRRRGHADRLHHAVRQGPARRDAVADAGPEAQLQLSGRDGVSGGDSAEAAVERAGRAMMTRAEAQARDDWRRAHVPLYNDQKLKLGVFSINCSNGVNISHAPTTHRITWEHQLAIARRADAMGFELLLPVARWRGFGGTTDFNG